MTAPAVLPTTTDSSQQVQTLLQQIFNSANWKGEIEKTVKKNVRLQAIVKDQKASLDKFEAKFNLQTGEPKEGKLLTKEEAVVYAAFVELKLKPEDLKKTLEEHAKLKVKEDEREQEERFTDAAEALGYENVAALTRWLMREKLVLEFKDQRVEELDEDGNKTGKKKLQRMPYVKAAGDDKAAPEPLEDYIEREVPEFVDIFKTKPESDDDEEGKGSEEGDGGGDFIQRAAREAEARVRSKGGVRIPATRSARTDSLGSKNSKTLEELEKTARSDSMYRSL